MAAAWLAHIASQRFRSPHGTPSDERDRAVEQEGTGERGKGVIFFCFRIFEIETENIFGVSTFDDEYSYAYLVLSHRRESERSGE